MIQNLAGPKSHLEERVDIAAYLRRIGYTGPIVPTLETLREIHRAHLLAVPFENLDIPLGRQIACDEDIFVCKIVERRRGGFCYEMNGAWYFNRALILDLRMVLLKADGRQLIATSPTHSRGRSVVTCSVRRCFRGLRPSGWPCPGRIRSDDRLALLPACPLWLKLHAARARWCAGG